MSSLGSSKDSMFELNNKSNKSRDNRFSMRYQEGPRRLKDHPGKELDCFELDERPIPRRKFSEHESNLLLNADILLQNKEFELAKKLYSAVLQENPYNDLAVKGLGQISLMLDKFEEASKYYHALVQMQPGFESYKLYADFFYETKEFDQAKKYYSVALECNEYNGPYLFDIYKNSGNIQVHEGDFEAAEEFYSKAFTINPESDVLMVNFGTLELQKGNCDNALLKFREAVELNRSNDKAWVGLALIHRQFADKELAWANIEAALDFNPNNETALRLAIEWAFIDGKTEQIISRLEAFTANNQQNALMYFLLAKVLFQAGRYQHASCELLNAIEIDPHLEGVDELQAEIKIELSRIQESCK